MARAIDAKISAEPFIGGARCRPAPRLDLSTFAGRLGSLRIAENDLPGGLDTAVVARAARGPTRATACYDDPAAGGSRAATGRSACAAARRQVISVAQIHGVYVTYAWAFPSARAARAALRAAPSQRGVRAAPAHAVRAATRVVRPGALLRDDLFWVRGKLLLQVGGLRAAGRPAAAVAAGVPRASSSTRTRSRCG